jgi:hypothetical protein
MKYRKRPVKEETQTKAKYKLTNLKYKVRRLQNSLHRIRSIGKIGSKKCLGCAMCEDEAYRILKDINPRLAKNPLLFT